MVVTLTPSSLTINEDTTYAFLLSANSKLTDSSTVQFTFPASTGISFVNPLTCTVGNGFLRTPTCSVSTGSNGDLIVKAVCSQTGTIDKSSPPIYSITVTTHLLRMEYIDQ